MRLDWIAMPSWAKRPPKSWRDGTAEMVADEVGPKDPWLTRETGNTLIVAVRSDDGEVRVFDCIVRRGAFVKKEPTR